MSYQALDEQTLVEYIRRTPESAKWFPSEQSLETSDLADGNMNLVFRVRAVAAPDGPSVIVKQALPYARSVGESFGVPLDRIRIEAGALQIEATYCPDWVPKIYLYDPDMHALVMEDLHQHLVMRRGMMKQIKYPHCATHLGTFLARSLFYTSDLYLSSETKKKMACEFANPALCKVTEDLVFTHPFMQHPENRYSRSLEAYVLEFQADEELLAGVLQLREKFMSQSQALIHGDLHTGSIMVNQAETKVIDPEFACYGPMGFDIGSLAGNFALSYISQAYHASSQASCHAYQAWIVSTLQQIWEVFEQTFCSLWDEEAVLWKNDTYKKAYVVSLLQDTAGFAGVEMIRRVLGLAHVADLDSIADEQVRAPLERAALTVAARLIRTRRKLQTPEDVIGCMFD
ncbi:S-methyl-5-thioribose kinase [Alicyclobacillus acidoterrestris]|uniref:S-methyl-5-thioribose kinase n=1 Tax=Alicyclobacillus acidoterrestris (strain ATCC 49025 / DSM 3922 / CIP 106132 / NCIMB 13137 / GD3B) TaxID=1356854 RepID=T0DMS8_ALIAG|nr:S-methyl-5-thioribose kinase [Alicyclobacillus acidoterrestris]EPZ52647.1 hypothetical protein N007_20025 [Alicyclobacillus acidoterrestris ATCC 49025]UNO49956.1 S-methyl-5-thioribose kinase [Alicyclobacillus acidoterrestris]